MLIRSHLNNEYDSYTWLSRDTRKKERDNKIV